MQSDGGRIVLYWRVSRSSIFHPKRPVVLGGLPEAIRMIRQSDSPIAGYSELIRNHMRVSADCRTIDAA